MGDIALTQLAPGDTLHLSGMDVTVAASIDLTSDGWTWQEHQIVGHSWVHWFTVEVEDGEVSCATWTERPDLIATGEVTPGDRKLKIDGRTYKRTEQGDGTFRMRDGSDQGAYAYVDYEYGDEMLSFDRYGDGGWEASTGREVPPDSVRAWRAEAGG